MNYGTYTRLTLVTALFFSCGRPAAADPLNDSLLSGFSTSHFQEAASVFGNPAALAFQTDLNGPAVSTSLLSAFNRSTDSAFALGLAVGYFGFGYERLTAVPGNYHRYSFALGAPLNPKLYFGSRLTLTRSGLTSIGSPDSFDLGLQYRPSPVFALGFQVNRINQPLVGTTPLPTQWVASAIVRPLPRLELTLDVDTLSGSFAKRFGYQTTVAYSPFNGFQVRLGYHATYQTQVGFQIDLEQASLTALVQPSNRERTFLFGVHSRLKPKPSALGPETALLINLDESLQEEALEGSLFLPDRPSLWQKLEALDEAARRPDVAVVVVQVEDFKLGIGPAGEIFDKILALRKSGKQVIAFLGNGGIVEYLIASAAQKIYLAPGSQLNFTGLGGTRLFLKGTLDKIGIEAEVFARGKYKSAPEMFTRKESSPEAKEVTYSLLKELESHVVSRLVKSGRLSEAKWKELLQTALVSNQEAVKLGLVDGAGEARGEIDSLKSRYLVRENLGQHQDRLNLPGRIAIIHADGNILKGSNRFLGAGGSAMTPEGMSRRFKTALADPRTAAIVLRISSGGGEVGPSYAIADIIERAKKKVPVIVSMGSVAASGGYLIAAPANWIFADASTLTGSIGVFLGKANFAGLLKKMDLQTETLSTAPHAGLMSWTRPLDREGSQILLRQMNHYYEDFTGMVAKFRKFTAEKVETVAQGRVWSGRQAKELGLVDELGGVTEAIAYAGRQQGLGDNPEVREINASRGLFDFFEPGGLLAARTSESPWLELLPQGWRESLPWIASLKENPFLLLTPIHRVD